MNTVQFGIMVTYFHSSSQGKNHYTQTSNKALLSNLEIHHDKSIKKSWLHENIAWLISSGYITRHARWKNGDRGEIRQIPSTISFTLKGVVWLVRLGLAGARTVHKSMIRYLQKREGRFPTEADYDAENYTKIDPDGVAEVKRLAENVFRRM